jgi:acid-sensing ion channel, other
LNCQAAIVESYSTETCEFLYGYDLDVLITPEIIRTDENLKSVDPKKRGCYFQGEKKLKYFRVYSRRNCEFECLADYLLKKTTVNCTQFYMVRNETAEVCDHRQEKTVQRNTFHALQLISNGSNDCGCLEECDSIKYNVEIVSKSIIEYNITLSSKHTDVEVSLNFIFNDVDVVPLRRYQPFTFSDFLAQAGGFWGLFAGISVLSIVEAIYYLTLRWMVNLWRWFRATNC